MERKPLPNNLLYLTGPELTGFLRRSFRENNTREMRLVYQELRRRGIWLERADYGQYIRHTRKKGE